MASPLVRSFLPDEATLLRASSSVGARRHNLDVIRNTPQE
jgi:hypothetical protein